MRPRATRAVRVTFVLQRMEPLKNFVRYLRSRDGPFSSVGLEATAFYRYRVSAHGHASGSVFTRFVLPV